MSISELCNTFLYSESSGNDKNAALIYLTNQIAHPDKGSEFDKKAGLTKYIFRIPAINTLVSGKLIEMLHGKGYDALLLDYNGVAPRQIIGHTAFQIHTDNTLHVFSVLLNKNYRGEGLAQYMNERIIDVAYRKHIDRVRLGAGGHKCMEKIVDNIAKKSIFNVESQGDNWLKLVY
jgi:hypothetical protein